MRYNKRFLRQVMLERTLTVDDLARESGMTRQAIYSIAKGAAEPKASTIGKLARALGLDANAFFVSCGR